jgi:hypothetical protein
MEENEHEEKHLEGRHGRTNVLIRGGGAECVDRQLKEWLETNII